MKNVKEEISSLIMKLLTESECNEQTKKFIKKVFLYEKDKTDTTLYYKTDYKKFLNDVVN